MFFELLHAAFCRGSFAASSDLGYSRGVEPASCPSSAQNRTTAAANNETLLCVVAICEWECAVGSPAVSATVRIFSTPGGTSRVSGGPDKIRPRNPGQSPNSGTKHEVAPRALSHLVAIVAVEY
jgi:hypothetical protein